MVNIDIVNLKLVKVGDMEIKLNKITSPSNVYDILENYIGDSDREHFVILLLNTKNEINAIHTVSTGSLNASIVHPREVFKIAIIKNSCSIILAHNHPSGKTDPSNEDINITNRLIDAGNLLGIKVLDHVIIGNGYLSFKEKNLI